MSLRFQSAIFKFSLTLIQLVCANWHFFFDFQCFSRLQSTYISSYKSRELGHRVVPITSIDIIVQITYLHTHQNYLIIFLMAIYRAKPALNTPHTQKLYLYVDRWLLITTTTTVNRCVMTSCFWRVNHGPLTVTITIMGGHPQRKL